MSSTNAATTARAGPSNAGPSSKVGRVPNTPRDARIIALILASMGVEAASEGVVRMLMEFAHRYTSDILSDAVVFSEHAGKAHAAGGPDIEDVRLAVQAKTEHSMAGPLTKDFLLHLADAVNRHTLPPLPERYGIRLPPEKDRLTAPSFDILPLPPPGPDDDDEEEVPRRRRLDMDKVVDGEEEEDEDEEESGSEESDVGMEEVNGAAGNGSANKRQLEEDDEYD